MTLLFMVLCAFAIPAGAQSLDLSPDETAWLKAHPKITITSDLDTPPYLFKAPVGGAAGILRDFANRLEEILGIHIVFTGSNYAGLVEAVKTGAADVTVLNDPLDAPYEERYSKTRDFLFLPYSMWVRKDSPLLTLHPQKITGKKIIINEGWDLGHPFLKKFDGNTIITGKTIMDCANALLDGEADAYVEVYGIMADYTQRKLIRDIKVLDVYYEGCPAAFFVRKDWPELHSMLEKALDLISDREYMNLLKKWGTYLEEPAFRLKALDLTMEERVWLKTHPVVQVASDPEWAPVEYRDASGAPQGISHEYLQRIEKMLDIEFRVAQVNNWGEALERLKTGELHMASAFTETPERQEYLNFTPPYISMPAVIFTWGDVTYIGGIEGLSGKRVAVAAGELGEEMIHANDPEINVKTYPSIPEALDALGRREVDAFVGNIAVTSYYISKASLTQIKVVGDASFKYNLAMGVRKDRPLLFSILNKALAAIPEEDRQAITSKWISVKYEHDFDYSILWKTLGGVAVVVLLFLLWNRRLSFSVRERTRELAEANQQLLVEIEERKRTFVALKDNEERYRMLFNAPSDAIFLMEGGLFIDCNDATLRMFRCERAQIIGQPPHRFSPAVQPDGRPSLEKSMELIESALQGRHKLFEWQHARLDGSVFDTEVNLTPLQIKGKMHILAIVRDISARKRAEEELEKTQTLFLAALEQTPVGILIADPPDVRIRSANSAAAAIRGAAYEQLVEIPMALHPDHWQIYHPDRRLCTPEELPLTRATRYGETIQNVEFIIRRQNGEERWVLMSASPVRNGKQELVAGVAVFSDITEMKSTEMERTKLEAQLQQAQKMEAIGKLAGGVAHDFNNLLQVITGYLELLNEDIPPDGSGRDSLGEIVKAADRATSLVRQLLLFSRRDTMEPRPVDLNGVVSGLAKMLRRIIGEHIDLSINVGYDLSPIFADTGQIEQVIMNLCVNARDAMPGGGKIVIETRNVNIDTDYCQYWAEAQEGPYVLLSVADTGCGIPPELQERVFEPFFTTKEVGQGTGLGLATVYAVVKRHNGFVRLYSEVGHGTVFHVYLPACAKEEVSPAALQTLSQERRGGTETILFAEDDGQVRQLAVQILSRAGYQIVCATNGEEAIRLYEEKKSSIDLAILDVMMPKQSGRQVHDFIRSQDADLPIIFASGYSFDVLGPEYIPSQDARLIRKPFARTELLSVVREILDLNK
ncbi:MAG TPA: transporter substrate-binding domain-containing protein [Candidatus Hydrogenedentes bacterium]|nr:transporter substrate-binding domain-containing protein [Candidatus Hydrogenedentota bacterium]